jgi:hypothetical protein
MEFNFVKFEGRNSKFENRITITGSYSIGFPRKFFTENSLDKYKFVILYWDAEKRAIGIQLTNNEEEKSKFAIASTKGYGATVSAKSFFIKNAIDPKEHKGRYDWKKVDVPNVGEIFVIEIQKKREE